MDWHDIIDGERDRLRRIVAWMLAFAVLAERAYFAETDVRRAVLQFLRSGEAATLDYLADLAEEAGCAPDFCEPPLVPQTGSRPADAIRLALTLRALAALISAILHSVPEYVPPKTHAVGARREVQRLSALLDLPFGPCGQPSYTLGFIDTS